MGGPTVLDAVPHDMSAIREIAGTRDPNQLAMEGSDLLALEREEARGLGNRAVSTTKIPSAAPRAAAFSMTSTGKKPRSATAAAPRLPGGGLMPH